MTQNAVIKTILWAVANIIFPFLVGNSPYRSTGNSTNIAYSIVKSCILNTKIIVILTEIANAIAVTAAVDTVFVQPELFALFVKGI